MTTAYVFILEEKDELKERDISLSGVIDSKITHGEYMLVPLPENFEWDEVAFQTPTGLLFFK